MSSWFGKKALKKSRKSEISTNIKPSKSKTSKSKKKQKPSLIKKKTKTKKKRKKSNESEEQKLAIDNKKQQKTILITRNSKHTKTPFIPNTKHLKPMSNRTIIPFAINDRVQLTKQRKGWIRYMGNVHFGHGIWYGIELTDNYIGKHDGKVGNKRYFKTNAHKAIFVTKPQILSILQNKHCGHPPPYSYKKRCNSNDTVDRQISNTAYTHHHSKKKSKSWNYVRYQSSSHRIRPCPPPPLPTLTNNSIPGLSLSSTTSALNMNCIPSPPRSSNMIYIPSPPSIIKHTHHQLNVHENMSKNRSVDDKYNGKHQLKQRSQFCSANNILQDENILRLRMLQQSIQNTQQNSLSLEQQLMDMPSPSLPPTPKLVLTNICSAPLPSCYHPPPPPKMSESFSSIKNFDLDKIESTSDEEFDEGSVFVEHRNRFLFRNVEQYEQSPVKISEIIERSSKNLNADDFTSGTDTDTEDMYRVLTPTAGATENPSPNTLKKIQPMTKLKINLTPKYDEQKYSYDKYSGKTKKPNISISLTPRRLGTDSFTRMRSLSIQRRLNRNPPMIHHSHEHNGNHTIIIHNEMGSMITSDEEYTDTHSDSEQHMFNNMSVLNLKNTFIDQQPYRARLMSIRISNICLFHNPFTNIECPYADECDRLPHLSKMEYLLKLSEQDKNELLLQLLSEKSFVEACMVIEDLLKQAMMGNEKNSSIDEYCACYADILDELGRYEKSEEYYIQAIKFANTDNGKCDYHNNYGMLLHNKLNRMSDAEKQYKKCLTLSNFKHFVCLLNYAKLLHSTKKYKNAEKHFKLCFQNSSNFDLCHNYYAIMLYELKRFSESKYHFEKALSINKKNATYFYNFAKLLCAISDVASADDAYQMCLKLQTNNAMFNFEYACFLCFELQNIKKSIRYFLYAHELDKTSNVSINEKYHEICSIVAQHGLKIPAEQMKNNFENFECFKNFEKNSGIGDGIISEKRCVSFCQQEFFRFMIDNFSSFGSSLNEYLQQFITCELNDIRFLTAIENCTLVENIGMNKIHAKIMQTKIEIFKINNLQFIEWLKNISLFADYYEIFEKAGILTFEQYYHRISNEKKLLLFLGENNAFDVQLMWNSSPKQMRKIGSLSERNAFANISNTMEGI